VPETIITSLCRGDGRDDLAAETGDVELGGGHGDELDEAAGEAEAERPGAVAATPVDQLVQRSNQDVEGGADVVVLNAVAVGGGHECLRTGAWLDHLQFRHVSGPAERAPAPGVSQPHQQDADEDGDLEQGEQPDLTENHGPGIEKDDLDVEDHEDQAVEVILCPLPGTASVHPGPVIAGWPLL
jgi:hypothetical protein